MSVFKRWIRPAKRSAEEHFVVSHFDAHQDGTLAETETTVYEQHLLICGACREWVRRQERLAARLEMEMAPMAVLAPASAARIQQNLYQSMRRAVIMNNIRVSVAAVGALAVLALVVGAVAWWQASSFNIEVQAPTLDQRPAAQELTLSSQEELDERVIKAIGENDIDSLAAALQEGANPNAESSPGRPALFLASMRGNDDAARLLIDAGADVHAETVDGAILGKAAFEGHLEIVEMLLDAGADLSATGTVWEGGVGSVLMAATSSEQGDIARMLIERGADVNAADSNGVTPLIAAASTNQAEIATLLLEKGANIDHQDNRGLTALHGAALDWYSGRSSPEVARILIENGAALNIEDAQGHTPLDIALPDVAEILREAGAQAGADQSALNELVIAAIGEGDIDALAAALEAGADANAQSSPGRPALFLAARRGNADAARLLIDAGADVHAETIDGAILVIAANEGYPEVVETLLDAGADINAPGKSWAGDAPALYAAVVWLRPDTARLLVERGADVNQTNVLGETPLIPAAARNQPEIVAMLLQNGADIDHQDNLGRTALHAAAFSKYGGISSPATAQVLIEHGATLDIRDNEGLTPLDIALPDVAELLREAGAAE